MPKKKMNRAQRAKTIAGALGAGRSGRKAVGKAVKVGQAVSDIIKAVAGGIPGLMSINPTDRQAAVNDLAEKWDKEFEKILKKSKK